MRFPAADPSKAESFRVGISVRGVALDSKGNLWAASLMSLDFKPPKVPDGVSIMKQFQILLAYLKDRLPGHPTGVVNMIRPDGTQPAPSRRRTPQGRRPATSSTFSRAAASR